jgi:peptidyl-prolyl cis-trans isomerase A (cyclophilin A)
MRTNLAYLLGASLWLTGCSTSSHPPPREAAVEKPKAPARAPDKFQAKFETTRGDFTVEVVRDWAPRGSDRFYELIDRRFFDGARFYRVVKKFVAQFGTSKDPKANQLWSQLKLLDDRAKQSNQRGFVSFAQSGPNSRTTQMFVNLTDNSKLLDKSGFVPFGKVVSGMDMVDQLYSGYGDMPPRGEGPDAAKYGTLGDEYLERSFPKLDAIKSVTLIAP